jgi:hypothetical protein
MAGEKQGIKAQDAAPQTLGELNHTQTVEALHQDEALRVLAKCAGAETHGRQADRRSLCADLAGSLSPYSRLRMEYSTTTRQCCLKQ